MSQFCLLFYRNYQIGLRLWLKTLCELIIILLIFTVIILNPFPDENTKEGTTKIQTKALSLQNTEYKSYFQDFSGLSLAYAPDSEAVKKVAEHMQSVFGLEGVIGYESAAKLEKNFNPEEMFAGLVLSSLRPDDPAKKYKLNVELRFPNKFRTLNEATPKHYLLSSQQHWKTRSTNPAIFQHTDTDLYVSEGFLEIQHEIFKYYYGQAVKVGEKKRLRKRNSNDADGVAMLRNRTKREIRDFEFDLYESEVTGFRYYPCTNTGESFFYDFLYSFCFLLTFCNIIWKFGRETERDIPFQYWKRGVRYSMYWFTMYCFSMVHLLFLDLFIIFIVKIQWFESAEIFASTKIVHLLLFFFIYNTALILTAMIIINVITNAIDAVLVGVSVWLVHFALFETYMYHEKHSDSYYVYANMVFFFNNSIGYSMHQLKHHTVVKKAFYLSCGALLVNILVNICILAIVRKLKPSLYVKPARAKCYTRKYLMAPVLDMDKYEYGPLKPPIAIKAKKITTYDRKRPMQQIPQIKCISFSIYMGEITTFLGPNGSAKTTLLGVLAGWEKPTHGYVHYFENNLYIPTKKKEEITPSDVLMGNNPVSDFLTVRETMLYTIRLKTEKDLSDRRDYMSRELKKWLSKLRVFIVDTSMLVKKLNYEQKRLLCLCCVLACDTKIVFLDEPTLHMRWREQRYLWDILMQEKYNRAIVLATNSVAEANEVADRIGIIYEGTILAYGSPYYLKTLFGTDDQLVILIAGQTDVSKISQYLHQFIPNIEPDNEIGNQIFYKVPFKNRERYQRILLYLERDKAKLGIIGIYMVAADLSDIYYKISLNPNNEKPKQILTTAFKSEYTNVKNKKLCCQQMRAVSFKKLLNQSAYLVTTIVAIGFIILLIYRHHMYQVGKELTSWQLQNQLGFSKDTRDASSFLNNYDKCDFIKIYEAQGFGRNTLECGYGNFESMLYSRQIDADNLLGVVYADPNKYIAWYNQNKFHSAPLALNLLHNLLIKQQPGAVTTIKNNPIGDFNLQVNLDAAKLGSIKHNVEMNIPILLGITVPIIVAYFIVELAVERKNNVMSLYEIAGLNMQTYWLITFLWDFGTFCIECCFFIVILAFFMMYTYEVLAKLFTLILMMIFGLAIIPNVYIFSLYEYNSKLRAYLVVLVYQFITGIILFLFYMVVLRKPIIFSYIAFLFPGFAFLESVNRLYYCQKISNCSIEIMFTMNEPSLLVPILFMFLDCILMLLMLYLVQDYRKSSKYKKPFILKEYRSVIDPDEDSDVIAIKKKISNFSRVDCLSHRICVDQVEGFLRKDSRKLETVSFYLDKQEILCIRGPAHSGKSHLARQLVGIDTIQFGEVYICKMDLSLDSSKIMSYIGYCPQSSNLLETYTIRKILRTFFMIRGVPDNLIDSKINALALLLNFKRSLNKPASELTPSEKRKTNIALACVAYNKVLVFDEPTRGLPISTCREIWNVLRYLRFLGKTIIVFTNDSLECQVLSDKVIMFRNYVMLGYNSPYNLLKTYGTHIVLDIKLFFDGSTADEIEENLTKDVENLIRFARYLHEYALLVSRSDNWLKFYIPMSGVRFSYIWGAVERNRQLLNIAEYNISSCTNDHIVEILCKRRREHRT